MISSGADKQGTETYVADHPHSAFNRLGSTGLFVSQAGFGGYRISPEVKDHGQALAKALTSGINLIDTSSNYTDGGSEALIGRVLADLTGRGELKRREIVVVTKAGYIQGQNHELSRKRKDQGRPFPDLVECAQGLEHCIHPEFLADQLGRGLERLGLECVDVFLLHNPEYYLDWANKQGQELDRARDEYYSRIGRAFAYLEEQAAAGRVGCYGVSSNTLVSPADDHDFTSLARLWDAARSVSRENRFRVIQFPLNLLESGAVLEKNQPDGRTLLQFAREKNLGVLINRPFNAVSRERMVRLANGDARPGPERAEVMEILMDLMDSEERIKTSLLPNLNLDRDTGKRLAEDISSAQALLAHWEEMLGTEHWRAIESQYFIPRLNAAFGQLAGMLSDSQEGLFILDEHLGKARAAFETVGAWHAAADAALSARIKDRAAAWDADWARADTLSQTALRALRSTEGVSSVLVGMRRPEYVEDVLAELARPVEQGDKKASWEKVGQDLGRFMES